MSRPDPEAAALTADDFEFTDDPAEDQRPLPTSNQNASSASSRSPYHLPASEQLRGVANRIIFSRYYIFFYLTMMGLSLATIVLSLISRSEC